MATSSYERFISATPRLIWAARRSWTKEKATAMSGVHHSHENTTWFVLAGTAVSEGQRVGAGEWLFMGPHRIERNFESAVEFLSIGLRWSWPDGRHLYDHQPPVHVIDGQLDPLRNQMEGIVEAVSAIAGDHAYQLPYMQADIVTHARLHELGARWAAAYAGAMEQLSIHPDLGLVLDPRLEPVRLLVAGWPLDRAFDGEMIAQSSGLSSRQVQRLFREETGSTPREIFESRRHEHARHSLLLPGARIKEVAASVGFSDLAAFNRWFQRRSGSPPREFRKTFLG